MTSPAPPGPDQGADEPTPAAFYRSYAALAAAWDAEFVRVSERFAGRMQCRKGCSACCSQMFPISLVEGAVVSRAVDALPPERRERLRAAARAYLEEARRRGLVFEDAQDVAPRTGERLVCPALQDDACALYEARPLICRKWGIPVFDPARPDRLHACELNFRSGEAVDASGLVAPQRALLEEWAAVKDRLRRTLADDWRTTTVAEAILTDFAGVLQQD